MTSCFNNSVPTNNKSEIPVVPKYTEDELDSIVKAAEKRRRELGLDNQNISQNSKEVEPQFEIIGVWADDFNAGILWRILESNKGEMVLQSGESGSDKWKTHTKLIKKNIDGKSVLMDTDNMEEYYLISNEGLKVYDNYGYIATYLRVKYDRNN